MGIVGFSIIGVKPEVLKKALTFRDFNIFDISNRNQPNLMKNTDFYLLLFVSVLIFCSSCKVEKRLYQSGYHVEWVKAPPKHKQSESSKYKPVSVPTDLKSPNTEQVERFTFVETTPIDYDLTATTTFSENLVGEVLEQKKSLTAVLKQSSEKPSDRVSEESCETVVLTDGRRLVVKVLEITQTELRYRKCNYPDGPVVFLNKSDVDRVIYENGAEDIISGYSAPRENGNVQSGTPAAGKRLEVLGLLSMIFGILGFFIAGIPLGLTAVILGFISMSKFASRPGEFMGRGFMIAGIIIGFVAIVGALVVISMMA